MPVAKKAPTKFEKDNLPDDVKLLFNKGVDFWRCIENYELGVIDRDAFIEGMRKINAMPLKS